MKAYLMPHSSTYALALIWRLLAASLFLSVPSEFWIQVLDLLDVPAEIKALIFPLMGATCWTIVEVIQTAIKNEELRRSGKLEADYHDPTAKYWPLKIFVGAMAGMMIAPLVAPAVIAIVPKTPEWSIAFIAGASGYWFMAKRLPKILSKKEDDDETGL